MGVFGKYWAIAVGEQLRLANDKLCDVRRVDRDEG